MAKIKNIPNVQKKVNKVVKKVVVEEKSIEQKVVEYLESKGYVDITVNIEAGGDEIKIDVTAEGKRSKNGYNFCVNCKVEQSPFCCGTIEIGDIELIYDDIKHLTDELKSDLISDALEEIYQVYEGRLFYCTIPTNEEWDYFADGLSKAGFGPVATFTNPGSGNKLRHYIKTDQI